jgi:hypothetical protein
LALLVSLIFVAACSGSSGSSGTANRGGSTGPRSSSSPATGTPATPAGPNLPSSTPGGGFVVGGGAGSAAPGTGTTTPRQGGPNESCARGMQSTAPVTPTVWLVVDGSSSMNQDFEGSSRWLTLRSTLMDPGGVVDSLQTKVRFGLVIYAGGGGTECVQLLTVDPELNNLDALASTYPMDPVAMGTPTDKALEYVVNNLPVLNTGMLDTTSGPIYVVLATDGSPNDMCGGGGIFGGGRGGGDVEQKVVDVTTQGTQNGMQMFVISLAGDDARLQSHLEVVAAATASKTPPYVPSTRDDLIAAFESVIGGASCLVKLDGVVEVGKECSGSVQVNGVALECNQPDGWSLFDPSTVQLTGAACTMFLQQTSLSIADFPCEIFSPN